MKYRNLEKVRVMVKEATGLDISYAYDDLVFPENTAFIIQYDDRDDNNFLCYFHQDCDPVEKTRIFRELRNTCTKAKSSIVNKGAFDLKQKGQEVEFTFLS
jgi:hypothetical protein